MSLERDEQELEAVAIIGMAGRFPGAIDVRAFWQNLKDARNGTTFFSDEELRAGGTPEAMLQDPNFVKAAALVEDIELFDAEFFGFSPREAQITDPQQRLFLEHSWEALEHAGYDPETYEGSIGVFAGGSMSTYLLRLFANQEIRQNVGTQQLVLGNEKDHLAMRVSFKLGLRGPALNIQSGCTTSLAAVHMACQSLLSFQCDMALSGGVSIFPDAEMGYLTRGDGLMSPDGYCRAFDERAEGGIVGQGIGVVVLKRLEDALEDRDHIFALIRGSAINNDGNDKLSYTLPSAAGQAEAIASALELAEVGPETIGFVEAHGSGSQLGDSMEVAALTRAFRTGTQAKGYCALGTVKTNIGHLNAAAGIAALIKASLSLKHHYIPANLNFEKPGAKLDLENSPFYVNPQGKDWPATDHPRRAGVNGYGMGGTNVHLILEEAPAVTREQVPQEACLLLLSARSQDALEQVRSRLADHLSTATDQDLADIAYTLRVGRRPFEHRCSLVAHDIQEAHALLQGPTHSDKAGANAEPIWVFPGESASFDEALQHYRNDGVFAERVNRLIDGNEAYLADAMKRELEDAANTWAVDPLHFIFQFALAGQLETWEMETSGLAGYGVGLWVAACLAGVMVYQDAVKWLAARARVKQQGTGTSQELEALARNIRLGPPQKPVFTMAGATLKPQKLQEAGFWLRFTEEAGFDPKPLTDNGHLLLLMGHVGSSQDRAIPLIDAQQSGSIRDRMLSAMGRLWAAGMFLELEPWFGEERYRVPLPTYPFERKRYWVEASGDSSLMPGTETAEAKVEVGDLIYTPSWERSAALVTPLADDLPQERWLIFSDESGLGFRIKHHLETAGHKVAIVRRGEAFDLFVKGVYTLDPHNADGYAQLFESLEQEYDFIPERIVDLWQFGEADSEELYLETLAHIDHLVSALPVREEGVLDLMLVADEMFRLDDETVKKAATILPGLARAINSAYKNVRCRCVDVANAVFRNHQDWLPEQVMLELITGANTEQVAYRDNHRWIQTYRQAEQSERTHAKLSEKGTYLFAGAFGAEAMALAHFLSEAYQGNLVFLQDEEAPADLAWQQFLAKLGPSATTHSLDVRDEVRIEALLKEHYPDTVFDGLFYLAPTVAETDYEEIADIREKLDREIRALRALEQAFTTRAPVFCLEIENLSEAFFGGMASTVRAAYMATRTRNLPWYRITMDLHMDEHESPQAWSLEPNEALAALEQTIATQPNTQIVAARKAEALTGALPSGEADQQQRHDRPQLDVAYVAPRNEDERAITEIMENILGLERVGVEDNFLELGGTSMNAVMLASRLEKRFEIRLALKQIMEAGSASGLLQQIKASEVTSRAVLKDSPLVALQPNGEKRPLFFVHPVGGSVFAYNDLAGQIGLDRPFYGLAAYEVDDVSDHFLRLEDMAEHYVQAILEQEPEGPFHLGGWSFGGTVAFEMAQQFGRMGKEVSSLVLIDTPAPESCLDAMAELEEVAFITALAKDAARNARKRFSIPKKISKLGPDEQLDFIVEDMKKKGILEHGKDAAWMRRLAKGHQSRMKAMGRYRAELYDGTALIFRPKDINSDLLKIVPDDLQTMIDDPTYGWGKYIPHIQHRRVSGNHQTMARGFHAGTVAKHIKNYLKEVEI